MDTTTLFPPAPRHGATPRRPRTRSTGGTGRFARAVAGTGRRDPSWARPGLLGPARRHRGPALLGAHRQRLVQRVLLRRGPGRQRELEGLLLRLLRRGELDHRRQATGRRCGSWPCRCAPSASARSASSCPRCSWASPRSAVLYATVKRQFGAAAGLLAGAVLALTPVAVMMFRFNNPDALLVLLMTLGAYATCARVETGQPEVADLGRGLHRASASSPRCCRRSWSSRRSPWPTWSRRRRRCAGGSCTCSRPVPRWCVSAGWWIAIVELVPASARPYIGGSQSNSILELTLGYNGLGRITGNEVGSVGGGGGGAGAGGMWGATGLTRMFNAEIGGQISWLIPSALILLVVGPVGPRPDAAHRRPPRGVHRLGRLAARHRPDLQPDGRHLPRLLHDRARPGHRCPRRHGRQGGVGTPARVLRVGGPGRGDGRGSRVVLRPALAHPGLVPVAAVRRPGPRHGSGLPVPRRRAAAPPGGAARPRRRPRGRSGRARGVHAVDRAPRRTPAPSRPPAPPVRAAWAARAASGGGPGRVRWRPGRHARPADGARRHRTRRYRARRNGARRHRRRGPRRSAAWAGCSTRAPRAPRWWPR